MYLKYLSTSTHVLGPMPGTSSNEITRYGLFVSGTYMVYSLFINKVILCENFTSGNF